MTPERWRQITEIFHGVLGQADAARAGFLDRACAHDPGMRAEVEAMLAANLRAARVGETAGLVLAAETAPRFEPGDAFGPYRIDALIGAGGMGEVYRARDSRLGRAIALKVISATALDDGDAGRRLVREGRAAAALNHPNVCTIHDVGEVEGQLYIAMELIEGQPLDTLIPPEGLPVEQVLAYGIQIADAVAHAHDRGIIHRDLKPSNTLITPGGRAKVLDFGLAKHVRGVDPADAVSQRTVTERGVLVGTPAYLAPELLRGQPPDTHSDVWAVGVLLHEMASGASPFRGGTRFELSAAILHEPPAPLSSRVPPALTAVIERCLQKQIARRYRDGNEVRAALDAVQRGTAPEPIVWQSRLARPRLAILPLRNLSDDPDQDYFAEGLHDALITDLARISRLRVIARASVLRYRNRDVQLSEIADELRVDLVLTGTAIRTSDRVRITVQLLDVSNQEHLWAGRYDRPLLDVLSMQNDIVASITRAIELQLTPDEQDRLASARPPVNVEAYEAYLKGRVHCYKVSPEHYRTARKYFLTALDKDPSYALAYAGLAFTWLMEGDAGIVPRSEALPKMTAAISKALELDDTLAEAHELSAGAKFLYEWDWAGAEMEYVRTIELNPNRADAHLFYADFLAVMRREREARAEMARAVELDPLNSFGRCFEAWHRVYFGEYDEAIEQLVTILRAEPAFSSAHLGLWGAFYRKGLPKHALEAARRFFTTLGDAEVEQSLSCADGADYAADMHRAAEVLAARARRTYVPAVRVARLYAHAADPDRVFEWLELALGRGETPLIHLGVAWDWHGLRDDPRFESLMRRMNLPH